MVEARGYKDTLKRLQTRTAADKWINKFGHNASVGTAAPEDIWSNGAKWVAPTQARIHNITAAAADNGTSATGALTVKIFGLDANFDEQSETVTLDGATGVNTVGSYCRIFRMVVLTAGSGGVNVGAVLATAATDSTVTAEIPIGENQTLMAVYTVPRGYRGLMNFFDFHIDPTNTVLYHGRLLDRHIELDFSTGPWQTEHISVLTNSSPDEHHEYHPPKSFAPMTDILLEGTTSVNGLEVSASFDIILDPV